MILVTYGIGPHSNTCKESIFIRIKIMYYKIINVNQNSFLIHYLKLTLRTYMLLKLFILKNAYFLIYKKLTLLLSI